VLILLLNSAFAAPVIPVPPTPTGIQLVPGNVSLTPNQTPVLVTVAGATPGHTVIVAVTPGYSADLVKIINAGTGIASPTGTTSFSLQIVGYGQGGNTIPSTQLTVTDGVTTATINVTVLQTVNNQFLTLAPYSAANMIAQVYQRTNENVNSVPPATIQMLLNQGMIDVSQGLDPVISFNSIVIPSGISVIALPADIQEIRAMSWSNLPPNQSGTLVYRLTQMDISTQMDFAGGMPGTGFGNPIAYAVISDMANSTGGNMGIQLYPAANGGYLNIYYVARPLPYTDIVSSVSNMDPQALEPLILWTCARLLEGRERNSDADRFVQQYQQTMSDYKDTLARRNRPKTGIVRDVTSMGATGAPPWLP
jgi:hypothetical protein